MTIISEFLLQGEGKIQIVDEPRFTAISRLPWCDLNVELKINIFTGKYRKYDEKLVKTELDIYYTLDNIFLSIYLGNVLLGISAPLNKQLNQNNSNSSVFHIILNTFNVNYIESLRMDDIIMNMRVTGIYSGNVSKDDNQYTVLTGEMFTLPFQMKFSEKQWLKLLSEMGYGEKMVIAIDRPKLEGYHEVLDFIEKANEGLLNNDNPDYIISDLRSAWDKMDVYILNFNKEIKNSIDSKSKKEDKQPTKDERVESVTESVESYLNSIRVMKESIDKFVQIGPHKEIYHSTREDALLAFRLTVSLMSYYSGILKKISEEGIK
jgi:hypothetical protein